MEAENGREKKITLLWMMRTDGLVSALSLLKILFLQIEFFSSMKAESLPLKNYFNYLLLVTYFLTHQDPNAKLPDFNTFDRNVFKIFQCKLSLFDSMLPRFVTYWIGKGFDTKLNNFLIWIFKNIIFFLVVVLFIFAKIAFLSNRALCPIYRFISINKKAAARHFIILIKSFFRF